MEIEKIHHKPIPSNEEIDKLAASIQQHGLLHPISVVLHILKNDEAYLLAGNKRLAACIKLGWTDIPAVIVKGDIENEDFVTEIRIHENLIRSNLPWYDQVVLIKQLHELRQKQFGGANKKGGGGRKTGWSLRDTSKELDIALGALSQDIGLADAILHDPTLRKIKDKSTALRLIRTAAKRATAEADALGGTTLEKDQVYLGDSLDVLKYFPDSVFDAVITDPPWLVYSQDETLTADENTTPVFKEIYRVMKFDSFLYAIVSTPDFFVYLKELPRLGFHVQQTPLIWVKKGVLTHGLRIWEYARDFEPILLAVKGNPALVVDKQLSSVFTYNVIPSVKLTHPHEKPPELIQAILSHCTYEGSMVLDPFAGSGVVLSTCRDMKRSYVGIERDKRYYDGILRRLQ